MDRTIAPARTVCHGCRAQTVTREVAPGDLVSAPCPVCGDGEDSGWLEGFVPPV